MFQPAQRGTVKLRIALMGPSGSGKTWSSLVMAKGLGGKVALIDTERGSGGLYSHLYPYDVAQLKPPFQPEKYVSMIKLAEQRGYDVIIIDSLSHAWSGDGGVLDMHDRAAKATRNTFTAWREVTPQHNAMVDAILGSSAHVIVTMRCKTAYEVQQENGRTRVAKVGLAPVQKDGLEYEFTMVLDLSVDGHIATATKDRTGLFDGQHFLPSEETGQKLRQWLLAGPSGYETRPDHADPPQTESTGTADRNTFLHTQLERDLDQLGIVEYQAEYEGYLIEKYGVTNRLELNKDQLIEQLQILRQCKASENRKGQFLEHLVGFREAA